MNMISAAIEGFATAVRKVRDTPFLSALNFMSLVLGFCAFLTAVATQSFWQSVEAQFPTHDRVGVITQNYGEGTNSTGFRPYSGRAIGPNLELEYPELAAVTRLFDRQTVRIKNDPFSGAFQAVQADPNFFEVFEFDAIEGDLNKALAAPGRGVLTESAANQLFGRSNVVGELIEFDSDTLVTVAAVVRDPLEYSHFSTTSQGHGRFDLIYSGAPDEVASQWFIGMSTVTYVLFPKDDTSALLNLREELDAFLDRRMPDSQKAMVDTTLGIIPLSNLQSQLISVEVFEGRSDVLSVDTLFLIFGICVLVISCVNYTNIATVQTAWRLPEVSLRKVLGANPRTLLITLVSESLLFTLAALLVALAIVVLVSPLALRVFGVDLAIGLASMPVLYMLLLACVSVSVLICIYPIVVSSFTRPAAIIQPHSSKSRSTLLTNALVSVQLAVASALVVLIIVADWQRDAMERVGQDAKEGPVVVIADGSTDAIDYQLLRDILMRDSAIRGVTQLSYTPWSDYEQFLSVTLEQDGQQGFDLAFYNQVSEGFFETLSFEVIAGQLFDADRSNPSVEDAKSKPLTEPVPLVIDDAMRQTLGFSSAESAIGQTLYFGLELRSAVGRNPALEIIGVVGNKPLVVTASGIRGNIYTLTEKRQSAQLIGLHAGNIEAGLSAIREAIAERAPEALPTIEFLDTRFQSAYSTFAVIQAVLGVLAATAVAIAVMGLIALAVFAASRRQKEIGIRKTIGAKSHQIVLLLLSEYAVPLVIGLLLATPISLFLAREYLRGFTQAIELTPIPWVVGFSFLAFLCGTAVAILAARASLVLPTNVLKESIQ
ncbi:MAG: FtsX-like permease family protein [Pseudomonadota bacterium]